MRPGPGSGCRRGASKGGHPVRPTPAEREDSWGTDPHRPSGQGESNVSCRRSSQPMALKEIWATKDIGSAAASGAASIDSFQPTCRHHTDPVGDLRSAWRNWTTGSR